MTKPLLEVARDFFICICSRKNEPRKRTESGKVTATVIPLRFTLILVQV